MMKKKMKGVVMDSSPSYVYEEQVKARVRHQSLMQDYIDLQKETEEKRRKIQLSKRTRRVVLAEVRFLRQRYEELMEYQSREQELAKAQLIQAREALPIERSRRDREVALPNPAPVLDLNQIANDEEEEIEVVKTMQPPPPPRTEKNIVKFTTSRNGKPPLPPRQKDLKLTVCRDIRKVSNKNGKRKISLQDPVALRV